MSPNELVDRVAWQLGGFGMSPHGDARLVEAGAIGRLRVSFVTRGYWQYIVRLGIVLELDGEPWLLEPGDDIDGRPRVLRDLVAISARTDERRDLGFAIRDGFDAPDAIALLDTFAAYEAGKTDTRLAVCTPPSVEPAAWPGGIDAPAFERLATTTRYFTHPGTAGGWTRIECAVRLRANAGEWSFERVPLEITSEEGMALS